MRVPLCDTFEHKKKKTNKQTNDLSNGNVIFFVIKILQQYGANKCVKRTDNKTHLYN